MQFSPQIILAGSVFAIINIVSFVYMGLDKSRAINNHHRAPEGNLFFLCIAFGALGIWTGMFVFRHKTKKWYFLLGVPLALAQNLALVWFLVSSFVE